MAQEACREACEKIWGTEFRKPATRLSEIGNCGRLLRLLGWGMLEALGTPEITAIKTGPVPRIVVDVVEDVAYEFV